MNDCHIYTIQTCASFLFSGKIGLKIACTLELISKLKPRLQQPAFTSQHHCHHKMVTEKDRSQNGDYDALRSVFNYCSSFKKSVILHSRQVTAKSHRTFSALWRLAGIARQTGEVLSLGMGHHSVCYSNIVVQEVLNIKCNGPQ